MTAVEIEEEVSKAIGLTVDEIKKIDHKLLKKYNTSKNQRLIALVNTLKLKKISINKLIIEDLNTVKEIYQSNLEIENIVSKKLTNKYFKLSFARRYFDLTFDDLVSSVLIIQKNAEAEKVESWLFMLSKKEKDGKMNNDDIQAINDLKRRLNGQ